MSVEKRIRAPISTQELERRWSEVRKAMKAAGVTILVMQNDNQFLGGYVRYFTDIPAEQAYPVTVLFPLDDEMTIISSGGCPMPPGPPDWAIRGIKTRISEPYFRTLHYTNNLDANAAAKTIKARNDKKVGLVCLGCMHAAFHENLKANLPGVEFVDATDLVDKIKAIKSEEELVYVRKAVETQDMVFAAVPTIIRPGKHEYEIRSEICRVLTDLGSEEQLVMMSSAPPGTRAGHLYSFYQNRVIQSGDQIMIMIEPNGPGGFYGELGRTWVLGEPPKELLRLWADALEGQKMTAGLCRPGASPAAIFKQYNEFLQGKGYPAEGRLFAHGQGYDLVERPAFRSEEDMLLAANMVVAIHPVTFSETAYAFCCDDFLISEAKTERMHKTSQEILIIEC